MRAKINAILEGLQRIDEAALPKNVLKKCTPKIKNKLSQFIDLQNAKITKVKGPRDPKYKTAYMRIYVMTDEYTEIQGSDDYAVILALADRWTKTPKWRYYDPRTDRFEQTTAPLAEDVAEYYVLLQSDERDNNSAYFNTQDLKHAREDAKKVLDPHKAQSWDYENGQGQVENQKLYISSKVGAKTRELKIQLIQKELDKLAAKFKFEDSGNFGYHLNSDTRSGNFGIYTYTDEEGYLDASVFISNENDITVEVDLNDYMVKQSAKRYQDAKEIRDNLRHVADICDNAVKLEKALQSSKELKDLLKQIK